MPLSIEIVSENAMNRPSGDQFKPARAYSRSGVTSSMISLLSRSMALILVARSELGSQKDMKYSISIL